MNPVTQFQDHIYHNENPNCHMQGVPICTVKAVSDYSAMTKNKTYRLQYRTKVCKVTNNINLECRVSFCDRYHKLIDFILQGYLCIYKFYIYMN